jgi:hypothetical protein
MTGTSAIAMLAAILMLAAPAASRAQGGASAPPSGTNSAGTAQSSGSGSASSRDSGTTTGSAGMGSGKAAVSPSTSSEGAIKDENATIDRKLKSICRGC